jgi:hypothetical protein
MFAAGLHLGLCRDSSTALGRGGCTFASRPFFASTAFFEALALLQYQLAISLCQDLVRFAAWLVVIYLSAFELAILGFPFLEVYLGVCIAAHIIWSAIRLLLLAAYALVCSYLLCSNFGTW